MRTLVLGAGAVGGYFGGRLAEAGEDVTFLVRPARAALLDRHGLRIESPLGDARMPVKTATAPTLAGSFDTVLLTAKHYDLDDAIAAIRPAIGPNTAIAPLLNGLIHLNRLDAVFGQERVLGGVANIGATVAPDGVVRHLVPMAALTFGERSGIVSDRVRALVEAFTRAQVSVAASGNIMQAMWEKYIIIVTLGGMACLMRGTIGEIMAATDGEALMLGLLSETEAIATASGYPPRPEHQALCRTMLTARGSNFTASMHRDVEAGLKTEKDAILGDMLARARRLGVAAPLLRTAFCHLDVYERRREARA